MRRRPIELDPDNAGVGKLMTQNSQTIKTNVLPTKLLAEIIVLVAVGGALSLVSHFFFSLPQGGSINVGMVPILWLSIRRGPKIGTFAGAVFGMVDLAIEPFVVHPIQLILDYPLAFAPLGLAGLFKKVPVIGVIVAVTCRFICHFVSGIVYFPNYAPEGMNPIVYSAIYNGVYIVPSMIVCAFVIGLLQQSKILNFNL